MNYTVRLIKKKYVVGTFRVISDEVVFSELTKEQYDSIIQYLKEQELI